MKDIEAACNAILAGAKLYVASDVPFFATRQGRTIGYSYAIVGAIRRVTRAPMILTGKPSLHAHAFRGAAAGRAGEPRSAWSATIRWSRCPWRGASAPPRSA